MEQTNNIKLPGLLQAIGNTPMIKIESLSKLTGSEIFLKCENLNPGGSLKDRPALNMVLEAMKRGDLKPGMTIVEGTAGNTGVGLAMVGRAFGFKVKVVMPKGMAPEKHNILRLYGAEVIETEAVAFSDDRHFFKVGKKLGESSPDFWWSNQFDNPDNYLAHYKTTGPEIYKQLEGKIDAFVMAAGSGGAVAGISKFLKEKNQNIKVIVPDPAGSGIVNFFAKGTWDTDGGCTMAEGVGIGRYQENYSMIKQDECYTVKDQFIVSLGMYLREKEGLVMGMSALLNVCGALKAAIQMGPGKRIATLMCDGGDRAVSKLYNPEYLKAAHVDGKILNDQELIELFKGL